MRISLVSSGVLSPRLGPAGRGVSIFLCFIFLFAANVSGQVSTGLYTNISGQVSFPADAKKLRPELVRVTLSNTRGAVLRERRLSPDASFDLGRFRYGQYVVTVSSQGFQSTSQVVDVPLRSYYVKVQIALGPRVEPDGEKGPDQGDETVDLVELSMSPKVRKELDKGRQRLEKGKAEKAIHHFKTALELCEGCPAAYAGLGSSYSLLGRWPEAEEAFEKSIELEPRNHDLRRELSQVYLRRKLFDAALEQLRFVLSEDPSNGRTLVLLGEAYLGLQNCGTALNYFQTASQAALAEHSCLGLGRSYYCAGRNAEALVEFKEFVEENPADPRSETVRQFIVDLEKAIRTGGSR
jgi:tetratricopeptide (TPR) repeat protein